MISTDGHCHPGASLRVAAPSGLAGNLIATALVRVGLERQVLDALPAVLGLDGFETVWDDHGVCDGELSIDRGHHGTAAQLSQLLRDRLPAAPGALAAGMATARFRHEPAAAATIVAGEVWCDTAFDIAAAAVGLTELGLDGITVYGSLPTTTADHPVARALLRDWEFVPCNVPLEIVTPTAAAILATCGRQLPGSAAPSSSSADFIRGRFVRQHHLEPVLIWRNAP